jgi:uncharacterized cysteine cluster protein YcgN (CxxCxxCC family)
MTDELPFWKNKTLPEMNGAEWESLCDGCGKCCLVKLEDEDTGKLYFTKLHCKLLDGKTCQCKDYPNRKQYVPVCVKLTPEIVATVDWLPESCAYRMVHEGKDLHAWHHLVSGDPELVHREGYSVRNKTRTEEGVDDEDAFDYVIDWFHGPRQKPKRRLTIGRK